MSEDYIRSVSITVRTKDARVVSLEEFVSNRAELRAAIAELGQAIEAELVEELDYADELERYSAEVERTETVRVGD